MTLVRRFITMQRPAGAAITQRSSEHYSFQISMERNIMMIPARATQASERLRGARFRVILVSFIMAPGHLASSSDFPVPLASGNWH
jgi:hypothetical protein